MYSYTLRVSYIFLSIVDNENTSNTAFGESRGKMANRVAKVPSRL